jgi:hypothetical protein
MANTPLALCCGQPSLNKEGTRIEEILSKQIDTILPTLDPIWRDTVVTAQGVGPISEFSKDFEVNKLYRTGMTGVIEQVQPCDNFMLYGDAMYVPMSVAVSAGTRSTNTFPDPLDGPKPKTFRLSVPMRAMYTNLSLTLGEMQMDATPAVVGFGDCSRSFRALLRTCRTPCATTGT